MSSLPPGPPPSQPPPSEPPSSGPYGPSPAGPPTEPPTEPPSAELLDARGGTAMGAQPRTGRAGRKGLLIGGGVVALALAGGGAWAAMSFMATGAQPAEALPAETLGYVSIDLDPSGGQKIAALQTLNKFPAFEDSVGLDPEDDLRASLFESIQEEGACTDIDFADDVDPWLGNRAAFAAVTDAEGTVQPVLVVQVEDAGAAETGLAALTECGSEGAGGPEDAEGSAASEDTEWVVEGDWAVVASAGVAQDVLDAAGESSLADDESYQRWTGETGDAGIVTMYAAPGAGPAILDSMGEGEMGEEFAGLPEEAQQSLRDFGGAAGTVRFADGSLEVSFAGETPQSSAGVVGSTEVSDQLDSLPDDTAVALGLGFSEGWFDTAVEQFATGFGAAGGGMSAEDLVTQVEAASGLSLPEDVEALTAGGVVLSLGAGLDVEQLSNSADPTQVPLALKLGGDPEEITEIIERVTARIPGGAGLVDVTVEGESVIVGPDADYRDEVAAGGALGESDDYRQVVPEGDASVVFYVNVNSLEDTIETALSGSGDDVLANITPLSAIGMSTSQDGELSRFVMRVGTDD